MNIRESSYQQQAQRMDATVEGKKISDNNMKIQILPILMIRNVKIQIGGNK